MRRLLPLIGLLGALGCSDRAFVANAAAARIYWEDRYERVCVLKTGPPACEAVQQTLLDLEHHDPPGCDPATPGCKPKGLIPVAQEVQKLGKMPKEQKAEIREALKKVKL